MKRSPLARGVVPLARTTRLHPVSAKRAAQGRNAPRKDRATGAASGQPKPPPEFTAKVRRLVRKRAGCGDVFSAECEGCGRYLGEKGGQVHHRAGRGSGGCRLAVIQSCANALLLCGTPLDWCHGMATRFDRHMRDDATGFWIRHGATPAFDPRRVAVMLHAHGAGRGGTVLWLAEDGIGPDGDGYLRQPPALERAA